MGYFAIGNRVYVYVCALACAAIFFGALLWPIYLIWCLVIYGVVVTIGIKIITNLTFRKLRVWRLITFVAVCGWASLLFAFMVSGAIYVYLIAALTISMTFFFLLRLFKYRRTSEGGWDSLVLSALPMFVWGAYTALASFMGARIFFGVSWWWLLFGVAAFVFVISYIMLWFWAVTSYERLASALVAALTCAELFLALQLLPITVSVGSAILTIGLVWFLNGVRFLRHNDDTKALWLRFVYVGGVGVILMLISSSWR